MNPSELKKPNVSEELAIELTLQLYGLKVVSIKRMVSFDDQNFHIQVSPEFHNPYITNIAPNGYTLKVTNTKKSAQLGHFDSMHAAIIHTHKKGLRVPVPITNTEGRTWMLRKVPLLNEVSKDSEECCGIHLLTFLTGQPKSTVTSTNSLFYQWGFLLAQFHNATEDLSSPYLKTKDIFWNLAHVPEIKNLMEGLDEDKKEIIYNVLNQYSEKIQKNLPNLQRGFIHGDFNENNILVQISDKSNENEPEYIVDGILDFEDMHYGTYVWDIGCMLAYALLECKTIDPLEGTGHALAGYLSIRSLNKLDKSLLKMCAALRLCQSLVLGAFSYNLDPSNSYLLVSAKFGWSRLQQIWNTSDEELLSKWEKIQNQYNKKEI